MDTSFSFGLRCWAILTAAAVLLGLGSGCSASMATDLDSDHGAQKKECDELAVEDVAKDLGYNLSFDQVSDLYMCVGHNSNVNERNLADEDQKTKAAVAEGKPTPLELRLVTCIADWGVELVMAVLACMDPDLTEKQIAESLERLGNAGLIPAEFSVTTLGELNPTDRVFVPEHGWVPSDHPGIDEVGSDTIVVGGSGGWFAPIPTWVTALLGGSIGLWVLNVLRGAVSAAPSAASAVLGLIPGTLFERACQSMYPTGAAADSWCVTRGWAPASSNQI